mgnify:CR=1 FL=1
MTTPSTPRKAGPLLGTGAQTSWPFTFKVFAASDIAVTIANNLGVETALVLGTDYSVAVNANQDTSPGGTVTYPLSGSALPVGSKLTIIGNLPYDQPLDLPSGGNFSPLALENELDRLTMQIQQLREQVGRAIQVSVTTGANVGLPAPSANELIGWDSTGNNLQNFAVSELATAVAYATMKYDTFTGDGTTTQFTLTADPVTLANLDVAISGVTQVPGADYSLVNGVLVFTSAPANGTEILARYGEGLVNVGGDSSDIRFLQAGTGAVDRTVQSKLRETVSSVDFNNTRGLRNYGFGANVIVSMAPAGAGTGVDNIAIGENALNACTAGFGNIGIGTDALKSLTTPAYCVAVGPYALATYDQPANVNAINTAIGAYTLNKAVAGAQYNTAVGGYALKELTTGYFNTAIGQNCMPTMTSGFSNTGVGHSSLQLATGNFNTAVGDNAAKAQTTAVGTVAVGYNALENNQTGDYNIAVGYAALAQTTVGSNIGIGRFAGYSLQTGQYNVAIGDGALTTAAGAAARNVGIGADALAALTTNPDCTAVGYRALYSTVNSQQTAFGSLALSNATNGGGLSTAVGYNAGGNVTSGANIVAIGGNAGTDAVRNITTGSNEIVIGNNSHTAAYIKVAWTVTSDERDKINFAPVPHGLAFVNALKPTAYQMVNSRQDMKAVGPVRYGFKAQDILALEGGKPVIINADDPEHLKYNQDAMIAVLVNAINELSFEVQQIKKQLT